MVVFIVFLSSWIENVKMALDTSSLRSQPAILFKNTGFIFAPVFHIWTLLLNY